MSVNILQQTSYVWELFTADIVCLGTVYSRQRNYVNLETFYTAVAGLETYSDILCLEMLL